MFENGRTYTDERPRWVLMLGGHTRGAPNMSLRFSNVDDMLLASSRARAYGYTFVRSIPHKNN